MMSLFPTLQDMDKLAMEVNKVNTNNKALITDNSNNNRMDSQLIRLKVVPLVNTPIPCRQATRRAIMMVTISKLNKVSTVNKRHLDSIRVNSKDLMVDKADKADNTKKYWLL